MPSHEISEKAKAVVRAADDLKSPTDLAFVIESLEKLLEVRIAIASTEDDVGAELEESRLVQALLGRKELILKGPDAALLSCFYLLLEAGLESFAARQVSRILRKFDREVANITTTMKLLIDRGECEVTGDDSGHRDYKLTNDGILKARDLVATHM